jgi:hypothetical protein
MQVVLSRSGEAEGTLPIDGNADKLGPLFLAVHLVIEADLRAPGREAARLLRVRAWGVDSGRAPGRSRGHGNAKRRAAQFATVAGLRRSDQGNSRPAGLTFETRPAEAGATDRGARYGQVRPPRSVGAAHTIRLEPEEDTR